MGRAAPLVEGRAGGGGCRAAGSRVTFAPVPHPERSSIMRTLLAAAVLTLATGCIVVPRGHVLRDAVVAPAPKKCPPGHLWSDGACHDRGRGHDKDKSR